MKIKEFIEKYRPCREAKDWLLALPKNYTMKTAWNKCEKSDWILWLLERLPLEQKPEKAEFVKIAVACAKRVLPIFEEGPEDKRPAKAIAAAERWIADPSEENRIAASFASFAAFAASASFAAAANAVAHAAADAAARSAAYAAAYATRKEEYKAQADIVRGIVKNPFERRKK